MKVVRSGVSSASVAKMSRVRSQPNVNHRAPAAERVETHAQREFLVDSGCRVCQGDLFAAPGPADEVEPFLRARRAA